MSELTVIKTGGKQYLVKKGDIIDVEKIEGKPGKKVLIKDVLLSFIENKKGADIGQPYIKADIEAEILSQEKGKKITIIKYKPKIRYHKKQGHRQLYTKIKIINIKK